MQDTEANITELIISSLLSSLPPQKKPKIPLFKNIPNPDNTISITINIAINATNQLFLMNFSTYIFPLHI